MYNEQLNDALKALNKTLDKMQEPVTRSVICELPDGGTLKKVAEYTVNAKRALVAYIMQRVYGNMHTWEYPEIIQGMRESTTKPGTWYYDHENSVFAAYEC